MAGPVQKEDGLEDTLVDNLTTFSGAQTSKTGNQLSNVECSFVQSSNTLNSSTSTPLNLSTGVGAEPCKEVHDASKSYLGFQQNQNTFNCNVHQVKGCNWCRRYCVSSFNSPSTQSYSKRQPLSIQWEHASQFQSVSISSSKFLLQRLIWRS